MCLFRLLVQFAKMITERSRLYISLLIQLLLLHRSCGFSIRRATLRKIFTSLALSEKNPEAHIGIGVGIDLGTTNSAIAFLDGSKPRIIEIPGNGRTMKSVVAFDKEGNALVGNDAITWERATNLSAYRHVKRVLGMGANFIPQETSEVVPHLVPVSSHDESSKNSKKKKKKPTLLKLLKDAKENPAMLFPLAKATGGEKVATVSPETISSMILTKLLAVAIDVADQTITRAVIGVPAYFNDAQRDATVRAANQAGIEKVKLLREPEAAALAYGVDKDSSEEEELVLVLDLGGGTYDVSILLIEKKLTEIVCTSGDAQLGGSNFDAKIAKHLSKVTGGCCNSELCSDSMVRTAEAIRIYLSNSRRVNLALPTTDEGWCNLADAGDVIISNDDDALEAGRNNATHTFCQMTRKEMEKMCLAELLQLVRPIREVAIMTGALLPGDAAPSMVESAVELERAFTNAENFYDDDDDTDLTKEVNAKIDFKAAKKMQQKGRKTARKVAKEEVKYRAESRKVTEAQPEIRVNAEGITGRPISRVVLVGGATRMPAIGRMISALTGITPQKTVDPDEAVALGCGE